jgi:hypothetical protein
MGQAGRCVGGSDAEITQSRDRRDGIPPLRPRKCQTAATRRSGAVSSAPAPAVAAAAPAASWPGFLVPPSSSSPLHQSDLQA